MGEVDMTGKPRSEKSIEEARGEVERALVRHVSETPPRLFVQLLTIRDALNELLKIRKEKKRKRAAVSEDRFVSRNVRVEINRPGEGIDAHEYEYCPIQFAVEGHSANDTCPLKPGPVCKFGLTEVAPPKDCPLRALGRIEMCFSVVKERRRR